MTPFEEALQLWQSMASLRLRRSRYKRFTYGRQWDDPVKNPTNRKTTTERALLSKDGRPPLTNNLIRQMVKSVVGRFRQQNADSGGPAGNPLVDSIKRQLDDIYTLHNLDELDSRMLEEFLISGIAAQRVGTDPVSRLLAMPLVENVAPNRLFLSFPSDPRAHDIHTIGMLRDLTPQEVAMQFGGQDRTQALNLLNRLKLEYESEFPDESGAGTDTAEMQFHTAPNGKVRVVEVWKKETRDYFRVHDPLKATYTLVPGDDEQALLAENRRRTRKKLPPLNFRWQLSWQWVARWYLSTGELLMQKALPPGFTHPFAIKLYPLIDGEIHSLVEDVVDQQKYVNRLVNMLDRMMATAAKGALLYPVDALPDGAEFEDIARLWSKPDGLVLYRDWPNGNKPEQLSTTVGDIGARDMLKTQMQLFKEISGVTDALAGRNLSPSTGAERYNLEIANSSISIRDLLDTFNTMLAQRDALLLRDR